MFHAVGNSGSRIDNDVVNIKCSHIYLSLIDELKREGLPIELVSPENVKNFRSLFHATPN